MGSPVVIANDDADHVHAPIVVRSRPVIERLPLKVIQPVDIAATATGELFVADREGEAVFRIDASKRADVMSRDLKDLSRVAPHRLGIFCLTSNGRTGSVVQLTENGFQSQPVYLNFQPAGLATDEAGDVFIGNARRSEVIRMQMTENGWRRDVIQISEPVKDLRADGSDNIVVLLRSGKVISLSTSGRSDVLGFVPESASRLSVHPEHGVMAVGLDDSLKTCLFRPTKESAGRFRFASLPEGTVAVTFDRLGNLASANPDLRAITQVTSRFQIPCPHCGEQVPMILSPNAPAPPANRRSF